MLIPNTLKLNIMHLRSHIYREKIIFTLCSYVVMKFIKIKFCSFHLINSTWWIFCINWCCVGIFSFLGGWCFFLRAQKQKFYKGLIQWIIELPPWERNLQQYLLCFLYFFHVCCSTLIILDRLKANFFSFKVCASQQCVNTDAEILRAAIARFPMCSNYVANKVWLTCYMLWMIF